MTPFGYKDYQNRTSDALRGYLRLAAQTGNADLAFYQYTLETEGKGRQYLPVEALPGLPYVCLRVPTGGGKTVIACRAVPIATQELLRQERAVILWLVPTNTIKTQTLAALRNRKHPYRQLLDSELQSRIVALDLSESLSVQRATLDANTVIIVSTMAALRVENTDGRKIYEESGSLMSHFDGLPAPLAAVTERYANGTPVYSLCNVLRLRRPVVIVDEAHNARTDLSFDTLARFNPSGIIEYTATPDRERRPSNVLYHVSAAELKAEGMIKLPIRLDTHGDALEALTSARHRRDELQREAEKERIATGEYIRPIVLIQAEKQGNEYTPERVRHILLDMGLPPEQIAIETGAVSELGDTDLFAPACPIRYIITVDKLREGWDCSFAYVLCSVRDMRSKTAIEQILGRVLRMPRAERKQQEALNHAYAIVSSNDFAAAANTLGDALIENGFSRYEAAAAIAQTSLPLGGLFTSAPTPTEQTPAERGERFAVPQLALWENGLPEPVEKTHFLQSNWKLSSEPALLTEAEFSPRTTGQAVVIDVTEAGKLTTRFISDLQQQLTELMPDDFQRNAQLAVWLDRNIKHSDITQTQSQEFLLRLVEYLTTQRGLDLRQLSRARVRLRDAAEKKIDEYRQAQSRRVFEQLLFEQPSKELQVSPHCVFTFGPDDYPVTTPYTGAKQFPKHYYRQIGDMNGEEVECAWTLENLPKVKTWVRNLEQRPKSSFWLQTATDRFYPDFIAKLHDDRVLAVEYKGADRLSNDDTKEKRRLGELWAERSQGACLFLLVGKHDYAPRLVSAAG